ncbi:MAG: hypothetical protein U0514_00610 [Candidatus Andersenbacteria bacterium]
MHTKHRMAEHFIRLVERVADIDEVVGIHGDRWGGAKNAHEASPIWIQRVEGRTLHLQLFVKGTAGRLHVLTSDPRGALVQLQERFGAELRSNVALAG